MERRRFLALAGTVGAGSLAGCTFQRASETGKSGGATIALDPVVEGLHFPTAMEFLPNGDALIVERFGIVYHWSDDGLVERPFLNLRDRMAEVKGERGLLGVAAHPNFSSNRKLYIRYSAPTREWMEDGLSHTAVLSEFTVTDDLSGVVPDSERILFELPEPGKNHNAGDLTFGPDEYLYASLGDGQRTSLNEKGFSWWYDQGLDAQNRTDNLFGGILRLDVDARDGDKPYGIPSDNPLVGREGRDEYYSWGLRNPYRISFDNGRLFVGDVGEHTRESVYITEKGVNHGWPVMEGSACSPVTSLGHKLADNPLNALNPKVWLAQVNRVSPVKVCPTPGEASGPFRNPILEYQRTGSRAVTGGYVYRGNAYPELGGKYIFGDYAPPAPIFAAEETEDGTWSLTELVIDGTDSGRLPSDSILAFARDDDGEVYALTTQFSEGSGRVHQITSPS